jgi:Zn-dependent M28 family amino/carboxypeptidase
MLARPQYDAALLTLLLSACHAAGTTSRPVTVAELEGHARFLADDLLEGRGVGTRGIEVAALYHQSQFRALGLAPAFGNSYGQAFELVGSTPDPEPRLEVDGVEPLAAWRDFVVGSHHEDVGDELSGELVYAGYLIDAPQRHWDDIAGADLKDKILLVEVNEPGNEPGGIFDGTAMTYYGRWTYKFEKASELGARGVLIIHNTKGAAYGWDVVRNSWSGESLFVPGGELTVGFFGWVQGEVGDAILRAAGKDAEQIRASANTPEFAPVPLGITGRVTQRPAFRRAEATNVAGILHGEHPARTDRAVVLSAHFDHLGKGDGDEEDTIFNGAVDNCSASAAMLALARRLSDRRAELALDVIFLAPSAEEQGLLGSTWFAENLPVAKESIWANVNLEMVNVWGPTRDVFAIGSTQSDLDSLVAAAAADVGLTYVGERDREHGFYFRSDQMSFARVGIPGVWLHEGPTAAGDDRDAVSAARAAFRAGGYHTVDDEVTDDWDLRGAVQIVEWAEAIVGRLSAAKEKPRFLPTSYFAGG